MNVYQHLYPKFGNDAVWMCVYLLCALVCWRCWESEKTGKRNNSSHRAKAFTSKTISCSFFMLFINALCVVCATINSSKNGCFSDYTEKWSIFPSFCTRILFGLYCAAVFWEWKEQREASYIHSHIQNHTVGCDGRKLCTHQSSDPTQQPRAGNNTTESFCFYPC